mmetsp:Transcript_9231/g.25886  ORF Transcript_9231/g.25886 Transcript_9231/m.25886 type:complete len:225 (-) Transcript_9231:98-772(-)
MTGQCEGRTTFLDVRSNLGEVAKALGVGGQELVLGKDIWGEGAEQVVGNVVGSGISQRRRIANVEALAAVVQLQQLLQLTGQIIYRRVHGILVLLVRLAVKNNLRDPVENIRVRSVHHHLRPRPLARRLTRQVEFLRHVRSNGHRLREVRHIIVAVQRHLPQRRRRLDRRPLLESNALVIILHSRQLKEQPRCLHSPPNGKILDGRFRRHVTWCKMCKKIYKNR